MGGIIIVSWFNSYAMCFLYFEGEKIKAGTLAHSLTLLRLNMLIAQLGS